MVPTWTKCLGWSLVFAALGIGWDAWAQEAVGAAPAGGISDILVWLGIPPELSGSLGALGLPGVLLWLGWRAAVQWQRLQATGGVVVQVRIPDDQLARIVAALRDDTADEPAPPSPGP